MATSGGRFRELVRKYGKVALGVHFSVSAASITGLYIAIKNNVDVESLLNKVGISSTSKQDPDTTTSISLPSDAAEDLFIEDRPLPPPRHKKNRTAELAASSGGALALAFICNKALLPIRIPITIALTPAVSRFLARRRIMKPNVLENETSDGQHGF